MPLVEGGKWKTLPTPHTAGWSWPSNLVQGGDIAVSNPGHSTLSENYLPINNILI